MSSLQIKNCKVIVTCDQNDRVFERTNIYIRDGEIIYIGNEERKADETIECHALYCISGAGQHTSPSVPDIQPQSAQGAEHGVV